MNRSAAALLLTLITGCMGSAPVGQAPMPRWMVRSEARTRPTAEERLPTARTSVQESASAPGATVDGPASGERSARRIGFLEALDVALSGNVDLALSRAEQEVAAARLEVRRGVFLPLLEVGAGYSRTQDRVQGSFGDLKEVDFDTYEGAVGFGWRFNPRADRSVIAASEHDVESAYYMALDTERRLLLRVAEFYGNLVLAGELGGVADELVADGETLLSIARERERAGVGTAGDVALAETALSRARQQVVLASHHLESQSVRLANVLMLDPAVPLEPTEEAPAVRALLPGDVPVDPQQVLSRRPDVQAARRALDASAARTDAASSRVISPDVVLGIEQRYLGDSTRDIEDGTTYGASLRWTFSAPSLRHEREREAEQRAARVRLVGRQQDALAEVQTALSDVARAEARVPLARETLASAQVYLEIQQQRFVAGTALALEVLQAQGQHAGARADLATVVVAQHLAQARLLAVTGNLDRAAFLVSAEVDVEEGEETAEDP